ncbi:pantothenate kinase [Pollutimonas nitritireducens]|uniref:Type III pantothenate kinase n=1 Tax=Pollutimonas nitritireducens TaxID=2045209 RepID=A0A2N4UHL9_9BURK|nr:type III pantothenate kinase [Pollutimonas nitritireducens]PLC54512.1 pantothenate kinase [Pollutimonas nitritireducens]
MILLIDAGNTRIKIGWLDSASGRREKVALALRHADMAELRSWANQLESAPLAAIGVNVAGPDVGRSLAETLRRDHSLEIRWVESRRMAGGVRNAYEDAGQLGADRWVSMIGLARHTDDAAMLATFGTATTLDTLGPRNAPDGVRLFHGGLILPGPELMRTSLAAGTANLPEGKGVAVAFPTHTHRAIATGIAAAQAGAVLRQWREGLEIFGTPPVVYSTGGGWNIVEAEVQRLLARSRNDLGFKSEPIRWLHSPVLDGLARLAAELL